MPEIINAAPAVSKQIVATFPQNEQTIDILRPNVVKYLNAMYEQAQPIENDYILHDFYVRSDSDGQNYGVEYSNETDLVRVADYAKSALESRSKSITLVFDHAGFEDNTEFVVRYGLQPDLSDAKELTTTEKYVVVENLFSNTQYYWQIQSGDTVSEINSFYTREGYRMIRADGIQNIRDMGGRRVYGGKHIKQGVIFRGGELVEEDYDADGSTHTKTLDDANKKILREDLGIKYEIDFRGDAEANNITESPLKDEQHSDIDYYRIPNLPAYDYLIKKSKSADVWPMVKQMFLAFKNANEKHVYFHCWGGADRTGTAGFLLGALLGMSLTDLVIDFELTSFGGNYRPHNINDAKKVYRFPQLMYQIFEGSHVAPFRSEGKLLKDIVADFLIEYAGLTEQDIVDIRANLLVD